MKNYLSFNQDARKLLPYWILIYTVFIVFTAFVGYLVLKTNNSPAKFLPVLFLLMLALFAAIFFMYFFIFKFCIEGVGYKDKTLQFSGTPLGFLGTILLGFFFTLITLGIYSAWFVRDMVRFFVNHTSYDSEKFEFRGSGLRLFGILIVTLLVPLVVFMALTFSFFALFLTGGFFYRLIFQLLELMILTPYMYFVYQWYVDIKFKNYIINWKTDALPSILKIAQEFLLMMITLYIYFPLAFVRLYGYFMNRTTADDGGRILQFGFDSSDMDDFLLIWKETLLTIVTLGIYYPWAICNINKRILGKTYIESFGENKEVEG